MIKCPACGHVNKDKKFLEFFTSRGTSKFWLKCDNCRTYFLGQEFDKSVEQQNTLTNSSKSIAHGETINDYKKRMFDFVLGRIKKYSPNAESIMDIGSSYGGFLNIAKDKGYKVVGTEIAPPAVSYMNNNGIEAYHAFSVKELPEVRKYDVITALDCNMYWPDQRMEFAEIKKRLSSNGIFIMRVVDKSWAVSTGILIRKLFKDMGKKIIRRAVNDHRFSMPVASLRKVLKEEGFEIINSSVIGAIQSYNTGLEVKLSFFIGSLVYSLTGLFVAPGIVLVMRKM